MLFLAALALRPSPEEPRSSLQPPRMPTLTHATIAAVETNHTALPVEGGGGMADVLTSVSKNFRPEEAFKSAAEAVQKLPAATKDKVKADVQSIVASLPPELASYMQARAEKLAAKAAVKAQKEAERAAKASATLAQFWRNSGAILRNYSDGPPPRRARCGSVR